jgi:hypothetical protein
VCQADFFTLKELEKLAFKRKGIGASTSAPRARAGGGAAAPASG